MDLTPSGYLGKGSYGKVTKVWHQGEMLAFKHFDESETSNGIGSLIEVDILSRLRHPNLLYAKDLAPPGSGGGVFLPLGKGSLAAFLERKILPENTKLLLCYHTLIALDFLHQNNLLHNDLKPENVIVFQHPQAGFSGALSDFGSALPLTSHQESLALIAPKTSLPYRAPEAYEGGFVSKASDMWSLGMLWYRMFGGKCLVESRGQSEVEYREELKRNLVNLSPPPEAPLPLTSLILHLLSPTPTLRPTTTTLLNHPFFSSFHHEKSTGVEIAPSLPILPKSSLTPLTTYLPQFFLLFTNIPTHPMSIFFTTIDLFYRGISTSFSFTRQELLISFLTVFWMALKYHTGDRRMIPGYVINMVNRAPEGLEIEMIVREKHLVSSLGGLLNRKFLFQECHTDRHIVAAVRMCLQPDKYFYVEDPSEWASHITGGTVITDDSLDTLFHLCTQEGIFF